MNEDDVDDDHELYFESICLFKAYFLIETIFCIESINSLIFNSFVFHFEIIFDHLLPGKVLKVQYIIEFEKETPFIHYTVGISLLLFFSFK